MGKILLATLGIAVVVAISGTLAAGRKTDAPHVAKAIDPTQITIQAGVMPVMVTAEPY